VRINPSQITASRAGENIAVEILGENVKNLGAFQVEMIFDPAIVHVQTTMLREFLASTNRQAFPVGPTIDNQVGKLAFGSATLGSNAGPYGAGILAVVTFQAQTSGTTTLTLQEWLLADINGNRMGKANR
jgi:general secretion pathway protein D